MNMMEFQDYLTQETIQQVIAIQITEKSSGQWIMNAVVMMKAPIPLSNGDSSLEEVRKNARVFLKFYEILDNSQLSALDAFYHQVGVNSIWMIPEELDSSSTIGNRSLIKKLDLFFELHQGTIEKRVMKKTFFKKSANLFERFQRAVQHSRNQEMVLNKIQSERSSGFGCLECLSQVYQLPDSLPEDIELVLEMDSLESFMKLDSPAADAVNLLPKADQPSIYGSLFGVLNRCKTKMGSKTLERWLRQPLLDLEEITARQDIVELFYHQAILRNQIRDGPLKNIPDLEAVASKLRKRSAGLPELFRLYLFVKSLPVLLELLQQLSQPETSDAAESSTSSTLLQTLTSRYLQPLSHIANKFQLYEQLIEHVVDFTALPEYRVNPLHDAELQALQEEQDGLTLRAEKILAEAKAQYGHFAEVRLEKNSQHGFFLRTTKGEDERSLKQETPSLRILSILKNGTHFTTPVLERISERYLAIDQEYQEKQQELVDKAVETALTYLPLIESVAVVISEIDVLLAFATAATISPNGNYTRPVMHPRGSGIIRLQQARHPCVELMDHVHFIANDYELLTKQSNFQIITGPNMGGKSTYIRGIGSIAVLAQIGMFVPCESAELSILDSILARVGAGDAVQKGVSTFMAEMLESSVILSAATKDSLLIIDELGRGTSTYDGFGIAWAMSDYIHREIGCFCLFATHFHEMTALAHHHAGIVNKHVGAHIDPTSSELVMLYQVLEGPCTESFGVFVAESAGFPKEVIREAKRKAQVLEGKAHNDEEEEGDTAVERKKKIQKMKDHLDQFRQLDLPTLAQSQKVRETLQSLFPKELVMN